MTEYAQTRMMKKLEELSKGNEALKIDILNQSIDGCWQNIYELKQEAQFGKPNGYDDFSSIKKL